MAGAAADSVICVLGMHRSGTSAITRLLNLLGMELGPPEHLMPPAEDQNPTGFWENQRIVELNDEILARLGGAWHVPPHFPSNWERTARFADLRQKARAVIAQERGGASSWGWKDPRGCLTLPFWQRLLPTMRYVICLRNPVEVARSLQKRDHFTLDKGLQLWLRHLGDALEYSSGQPRLFVSYEELIKNPVSTVQRLWDFLGKPDGSISEDVLSSVRSFVSDELHHHRTALLDTVDDPAVTFPVKALYLCLRLFSQVGPDGWRDGLDGDKVEPVLDLLAYDALQSEMRSHEMITTLNIARQQLDEHAKSIVTLSAQLASATERCQEVIAQIQQKDAEIAGKDMALANLRAAQSDEMVQLGAVYEQRMARLKAADDAALEALTSHLQASTQHTNALQANLKATAEEVRALRQRLTWKRHRLADFAGALFWNAIGVCYRAPRLLFKALGATSAYSGTLTVNQGPDSSNGTEGEREPVPKHSGTKAA